MSTSVMPTAQRRLETFAVNVAILVTAIIVLAPVVWTLSASFKLPGEIFSSPPRMLPRAPTLSNYQAVVSAFPFPIWILNSIGISLVATFGGVLVSAMAGFAFARYEFVGKGALFSVVMVALIIPNIVMVVPLYVIFSKIGLVDSYLGVILPQLAQPFGIFLMRQFITQNIRPELLDAARMEGASEWRIFITIVLPLSRPAISALGIWLALASYNNFLWPLVTLTSPERQTLPVGLAAMASSQYVNAAVVMAGGILAAIPSVIVFIIMRRQFISSLTSGSMAN